jgi:F0F1-type ATP synthase membrane subunit c/vacuolar-type H+-ATPase subunit K
MREWASSAHNLPIVTKMAVAAIAKNPRTKPADFATYLTLVAMG